MGLRRLMVGLVVLGVGCNGDTPVAPINPTETNTITITAAGASPQQIQIQAGERVLFVNNDDVVHDMSSDNHPSHLECPELNQAGFLSPSQSREIGNLVMARNCVFHDHLDAQNPSLSGNITILE
jgi:plastocyanin